MYCSRQQASSAFRVIAWKIRLNTQSIACRYTTWRHVTSPITVFTMSHGIRQQQWRLFVERRRPVIHARMVTHWRSNTTFNHTVRWRSMVTEYGHQRVITRDTPAGISSPRHLLHVTHCHCGSPYCCYQSRYPASSFSGFRLRYSH